MQTVLVANIKGGCGKTTIATHLAAALAGAGRRPALADVDRQRSSLGWLDRRPPQTARIRGLDWVKQIEEPPKKVDRLVIDAPAAMKLKQVETLIKRADVIVLPVLPSAFDETATARFLARIEELKPIRKDRTRIAVVGNRLRARTRRPSWTRSSPGSTRPSPRASATAPSTPTWRRPGSACSTCR